VAPLGLGDEGGYYNIQDQTAYDLRPTTYDNSPAIPRAIASRAAALS
jgi:hypothetical protein